MATTDIEDDGYVEQGLNAERRELTRPSLAPNPFAPFVPTLCPRCGNRFMQFLLDGHIRRCAGSNNKRGFVQCKVCGKSIKEESMENHLKNAHSRVMNRLRITASQMQP